MTTLTRELPDALLSALRLSPEEIGREMRLAAAIHWYQRSRLSQERAAQVAGLDRTDFLLALAREGVDAFAADFCDSSARRSYLPEGRGSEPSPHRPS